MDLSRCLVGNSDLEEVYSSTDKRKPATVIRAEVLFPRGETNSPLAYSDGL